MDIFEIITGRFIFNVIGATVRWIYETVWRTIFRKMKNTTRQKESIKIFHNLAKWIKWKYQNQTANYLEKLQTY
jgi:hypothetical protein